MEILKRTKKRLKEAKCFYSFINIRAINWIECGEIAYNIVCRDYPVDKEEDLELLFKSNDTKVQNLKSKTVQI